MRGTGKRSIALGPDAGDTIRSVLHTGTEVYAAVGNKVITYFRGKEVGRLESSDEAVLGSMILLGDDLLALKQDGTGLVIWNTKSGGGCDCYLLSNSCTRLELMVIRATEPNRIPQRFHGDLPASSGDVPQQSGCREQAG